MTKTKVFVAIPTTGTVVDSQQYALRELEKTYGDRIEMIYPKQCVRRIFHDAARNAMVEEFLQSEAELLWFLDSDVVPPTDIFEMVLKKDEWEVAGAPYPVFMTPGGRDRPEIVFTAYKGRTGKGLSCANVPQSGVEYIDGLATGCMFIKRHVFEKLVKPYFEFRYDKETRTLISGEDLSFCMKVNDLGYKFYVDYSMTCKHYKNVCLLEINDYAIRHSKAAVEAYDSMIREQTLALAKRALKKTEPPKGKLITDIGREYVALKLNQFK